MSGEETMDLKHRRETPCKDPPLQCECSSHNSFIVQELGIGVDLKLLVDTPPVGLVRSRGEGMSWSTDEADAPAVAGAGTSAEPEASSNHGTPKDPDTPSSFVADPEGVLVSVRSSSEWQAVTTSDATLLDVAKVARETREWVEVPGGTY